MQPGSVTGGRGLGGPQTPLLPPLPPRRTRPPEQGAGEAPVGVTSAGGAGLAPELGCCGEAKAPCTHHWAVASSADRPRECPLCNAAPTGPGRTGSGLPCTGAAGRLVILRGWEALWELKCPSSCTGEQRGDQPVHGDGGDGDSDHKDGSSFTRCQACTKPLCLHLL